MADRDLARDVLEAFLHEYPALREALRNAIELGDPWAIRNLAHTLKGAAANVGAGRVCRIAACLESEAVDGLSPRLAEGFTELDRQWVDFERATAALRVDGWRSPLP